MNNHVVLIMRSSMFNRSRNPQSPYLKLPNSLRTADVARSGKRERTKKLNFTLNVDFWFCNDDVCKKNLKAKNVSLSFFYYVKNGNFLSCPNSIGDTLQKAPTFFCGYCFPRFEAQCSQLTVVRQCSRYYESWNVLKQSIRFLYGRFWPARPSMG